MNYQQAYSEVDAIVTKYRNKLERDWPTPPAGDCLKFAVTEAGEVIEDKLPSFEECLMWATVKATRVIDAELRQNPLYARNNDKNIDTLDEVADCLMMLVSANQKLGYLYVNTNDTGYLFSSITMLVIECGAALDRFESFGGTSLQRPITICLQLLGEDAPRRVESRLQRIKAKVIKGNMES